MEEEGRKGRGRERGNRRGRKSGEPLLFILSQRCCLLLFTFNVWYYYFITTTSHAHCLLMCVITVSFFSLHFA